MVFRKSCGEFRQGATRHFGRLSGTTIRCTKSREEKARFGGETQVLLKIEGTELYRFTNGD